MSMISALCPGPRLKKYGPFFWVLTLVGAGSLLAGCSKPSSSQSLDGQLGEMQATRKATAKFAGTVTIDGKTPANAIKDGLFILLYDPKNPPHNNAAPLKSIVDRATGHFEFTTYAQGDGVPEGSYVVLFVAPHHTIFGKTPGYHQPDALKNLYNDPDVNTKNPEFNITLARPGKTDYTFDLKVEGKESGAGSGEHAVTHFIN
jgi:hypothetical protein